VLHEDRRRAGSFGEDPDRYDRARPAYPPALVDMLIASAAPARVLDIGCGTGKAGALFVDRGCAVLGVEPDARMAAVARRHGLEVEVAPFEEWDPAGRLFDLAVSGQAWHWIHPERGARVVAGALRPGGWLALFWNAGSHDAATQAALDEVYGRHVPAFVGRATALGQARRDAERDPALEALAATGHFEAPRISTYDWEQEYSRDQWLDVLQTHSDHRLLPEAQRAALLAGVGTAIDRLGGGLRLSYQTILCALRRSP
jgi:SAM-dependent methyltransferase